jgi:hypothetical protein
VGVISDVTGLLLRPSRSGTIVIVTFFVLLAWLYAAIWRVRD